MKTISQFTKWAGILTLILALGLMAACSSSPAPAATTNASPSAAPSTGAAPIKTLPPITSMPPTSVPASTTAPAPATTAPVTSVSPTTSAPSNGKAVTIDVVAQKMAFDKSTITVPAGASVTINFNNLDGGIPHNISVYQNLSGGQTKPVFIGDTIRGPKTIVYNFTAPTTPGNYSFICDIHPQIMVGTFVVTP
jgi:plastocyanin